MNALASRTRKPANRKNDRNVFIMSFRDNFLKQQKRFFFHTVSQNILLYQNNEHVWLATKTFFFYIFFNWHLSIDLSINPSTYLPIYLLTYIPISLSPYLPISLSPYLPISPSTYSPSTYLPIHPSVYLSIYLSIHLWTIIRWSSKETWNSK